MFFQLGDRVYKGFLAPVGMGYSGAEALLAEHPIISGKPRVQLTGIALEILEIGFRFRAEFCNPSEEIRVLSAWKDTGAILPLINGNGEYKNDYLIKALEFEVIQCLPDGTPVEIEATAGLLEYVAYSQAEQIAREDRKKAAALGSKRQISKRPSQIKTPESEAHQSLMAAQLEAWKTIQEAKIAEEATSPDSHADRIKKVAQKAHNSLAKAREKIEAVQETVSNYTGVISSVNSAIEKVEELSHIMNPPLALSSLRDAIANAEASNRNITIASSGFTKMVILRQI